MVGVPRRYGRQSVYEEDFSPAVQSRTRGRNLPAVPSTAGARRHPNPPAGPGAHRRTRGGRRRGWCPDRARLRVPAPAGPDRPAVPGRAAPTPPRRPRPTSRDPNALRCISRTADTTDGSTSETLRPGPATQVVTLASTAAWRSPLARAAFSASKKRRRSGVSSARRLPPGGHNNSDCTRSGRVRATSVATPEPNEAPTRWHRVTPRCSSVERTSATWSSPPSGRVVDSPKPRRSTRTTVRSAARSPQIGSHMRRSAMPAWRKTTGRPASCGRCGRTRCRTGCTTWQSLVSAPVRGVEPAIQPWPPVDGQPWCTGGELGHSRPRAGPPAGCAATNPPGTTSHAALPRARPRPRSRGASKRYITSETFHRLLVTEQARPALPRRALTSIGASTHRQTADGWSNVCSTRLLRVEVRGRWWNQAWARMARRDIWLLSDGRLWRVRGRLGGDGGQEVSYDFADEASRRLDGRPDDEDLGRRFGGISRRRSPAGVQPPAGSLVDGLRATARAARRTA